MAKLQLQFDPREVDTTQRDFDNLPDGIYKLENVSADVKSENGKTRISYAAAVIEPEQYAGRRVFGGFNILNPDPETQARGERDFGSACRAMEIEDVPEDTDDLLFKSYYAKIGMGKDSKEKNSDGSPKWSAKNEIKRWYFSTDNDGNEIPYPTPEITGPVTKSAANDNRRAANDNTSSGAGQAPAKRAWGKR